MVTVFSNYGKAIHSILMRLDTGFFPCRIAQMFVNHIERLFPTKISLDVRSYEANGIWNTIFRLGPNMRTDNDIIHRP
jgi:hypothetical protein